MNINVTIMIENFMFYHNQGKSIREIAEIFMISKWSVYDNLDIIAKNNNTSRYSLLERPHKKHRTHQMCKLKGEEQKSDKKNVDVQRLIEEYRKLDSEINELLKLADELLQGGNYYEK